MDDRLAISLKNVCRGYGNTKVIDNLNLQIKSGTINCLIGASGSGKTTILRTILGRLIPDSGEVLVFGKKPHEIGGVPGSICGFCPQEGALYYDLTLDHTLNFFSNVHQIPKDKFEAKKEEIIKLLDLPQINSRSVGLLSGGQKKRVSLAVALLHSPKLLILDEPTVGIDMEVASNIWSYLRSLANSGVTIIITTHYINEAVGSDNVFLLRDGKILENGEPKHLIEKYESETLEEVFLKLCKRDNAQSVVDSKKNNSYFASQEIIDVESHIINNKNNNSDNNENNNDDDYDNEKKPLIGISTQGSSKEGGFFNRLYKVLLHAVAIGKRKFIQIFRNKVVLSFELLSPSVQVLLYFLAIGGSPKNLEFGVVNLDSGPIGSMYINSLASTGVFDFHNYNSTSEAIEQIKMGNSFGLLDINADFTSAILENYMNLSQYNPNGQVDLYMDFTNYQITLIVEQQLELSFENLAKQQMNITMNPINVVTPTVYGNPNSKFIDFLAPGMVCLISFAHAISITSVSFVKEKVDGSLDRLFAYGVRTSSIVFGHFLGHLPLLLVQITVLLLIAIYGFNVPIEGNIVLVFLMTVSLAFVGMSLGLVISAVSRVETEAIQLSLGVYFPTLICSGTLWPLQSLPNWFVWFPNILPATHAGNAMRDIMLKGVGLEYKEVWVAFLVVLSWLIGLIFIATLALNEKDKNFKLSCLKKRK
ncbi:hypothetical protein RB653_007824 [Dictyostelium firmibasis]|uniref:ABC transporter G family member 20 n=1 Tax=Dictyostelium firmibasis TaxID=79012 RepID=A0AAN7YY55_9MYCE